jgi:predicted nuclease of predicted toxin-antitoxin system
LRLLADENIPSPSIALLREAGHDVLAVWEVMRGASDREVLRQAIHEDRIILTFDRDFGRLLFTTPALGTVPGLILLRFVPRTPEEPATRLVALFADVDVQMKGRISVVARDLLRQRDMPGSRGHR